MKQMKKTFLLPVLIFSFLFSSVLNSSISNAAGQVIKGKKGWLFYRANGDGTTIPDYQGINHYSAMGLRRVEKNLLAAEKAVNRKGAGFIVYLVPNKETIYAQYMPKSIKRKTTYTRLDQLYEYLETNTDLTVGYPKRELLKERNNYELYYPTDTHWNSQGEYIAAQNLMDLTDGTKNSIHNVRFRSEKKYLGDLCGLSNGKYHYYVNRYIFNSKVKAADKSNKKIFFVGDSYIHRLSLISRRFYKKVRFCHINQFRISMVHKGEIVVWGAAERYQDKFTRINFSKR